MTPNAYLKALARHIMEQPDGTFCVQIAESGETRLTWQDLGDGMGRFAAAYRRMELAPADQIIIFLRHVPELYGSFFGAMAAGMTPAFMPCSSPRQDPNLYWSSHQAVLAHIRPAAIVTDRVTLAEMRGARLDFGATRILTIEDLAPEPLIFADVDTDVIALLQHSSGTTGLKKGVALSYRAVMAQVNAYGDVIAITPDDVIVSWLPLYHDMGLIACMIVPAFYGIPTVHIDPFRWIARPQLLFDAIQRHDGTLCWLPNFAFEHLALVLGRRAGEFDLSRVRGFISCSEPIKAATFDRFVAAFATSGVGHAQLQCCYAMAETVFATAQTSPGERPLQAAFAPASLQRGALPEPAEDGTMLVETGKPLATVTISTHDAGGAELPEGMVGEIAISCGFLFSGYNGEPDAAAARLSNGRYFTRDVGFMRDGRLFVLGRLDDMIIVNGRNIYAHEVEAELSRLEGLKPGRAVAVGVFDERIGSAHLIVLAEIREGGATDDERIIRTVAHHILSVFEVMPRAVELMAPGGLIKTTSGKISRSENLKRYLARERQ